jgi:hypothetical protein
MLKREIMNSFTKLWYERKKSNKLLRRRGKLSLNIS